MSKNTGQILSCGKIHENYHLDESWKVNLKMNCNISHLVCSWKGCQFFLFLELVKPFDKFVCSICSTGKKKEIILQKLLVWIITSFHPRSNL